MTRGVATVLVAVRVRDVRIPGLQRTFHNEADAPDGLGARRGVLRDRLPPDPMSVGCDFATERERCPELPPEHADGDGRAHAINRDALDEEQSGTPEYLDLALLEHAELRPVDGRNESEREATGDLFRGGAERVGHASHMHES